MRKSAFWANRRQMEAFAWGGQAAIHLDTRGWSSAQCASIPWTLRLCWRPQCAHAWGGSLPDQKVAWWAYPSLDCSPNSHLYQARRRNRSGLQERGWKPA